MCKKFKGRFEAAVKKSANPIAELLKAVHHVLRKQWAGMNDRQVRQVIGASLKGKSRFKGTTKYGGDGIYRLFPDHAIVRSDDERLWRVDLSGTNGKLSVGGPAEVREQFVAAKQADPPPGPRVPIVKMDDEKQIAYGVVMEPDKADLQDDTSTADEIEKAAHHYMREGAHVHIQHGDRAYDEATVVENYLAPTDFELGGEVVKAGSWVMGVHVPHADVWQLVKRELLTGFSPRGRAFREVTHGDNAS